VENDFTPSLSFSFCEIAFLIVHFQDIFCMIQMINLQEGKLKRNENLDQSEDEVAETVEKPKAKSHGISDH